MFRILGDSELLTAEGGRMRIVRTASRQGSNADLAADWTIGRVGERPGVRPIPHEHGIAGLKYATRFFFGVGQNAFGRDFADPAARQVEGSDGNFPGASGVSEALVGTKGTCQVNAYTINGKPVLDRKAAREATDPYVQEHTDLIASIRNGKPLNEPYIKAARRDSRTIAPIKLAPGHYFMMGDNRISSCDSPGMPRIACAQISKPRPRLRSTASTMAP